MKTKHTRRSLSLEKFESSSWTPIIRRRPVVARRAQARLRRHWDGRTTAAELAARLLAAWQGGAP